MPPQTNRDEPVMLPAFGEARNAAAPPMSTGVDSGPGAIANQAPASEAGQLASFHGGGTVDTMAERP
jgi:hypothetical protein